MIILKKKLYKNLILKEKLYSSNTHNRTNYKKQNTITLIKQNIYTIYILTQENNKFYIKELSGILIKKNKMQNLTNLHFLCLKRYNNVYLSFFKEAPNILIKYNIKI